VIDGKEKPAHEALDDEADEYLAYIDEDEQRLHEMEAEGEHFSLWLGDVFLPWMIKSALAAFLILVVVQPGVRFRDVWIFIYGAFFGGGLVIAALWSIAMGRGEEYSKVIELCFNRVSRS
jgi:hypothetical protein